MSLSGVEPVDACITTYQQLKLGRKLRYVLFAINDSLSAIVVEKTGDKDASSASPAATYDAFVDALPKDACRWGVYDFEYEVEGGTRSKLGFISWSPDDATIRDKMLFASSREALKRRLEGVAFEMQGTDRSEIEYQTVLAKALTLTH